MIILGVDPGTAICGYGVIEATGSRLRAVHYGAVQTPARTPLSERLDLIHTTIDQLLQDYAPTAMGVEQLFFSRNVTTAISVSHARGVILLAAAQRATPIFEHTPMQVKDAVVGYGKADKQQVAYMVAKLLNMKEAPKLDDITDALAVAICTAHASQHRLWQGGQR